MVLIIWLLCLLFFQLVNVCGAKGFGDLGLFHIGPMAHAEEEETPKDEQRESKLPRDIAEDNPVLDELKS